MIIQYVNKPIQGTCEDDIWLKMLEALDKRAGGIDLGWDGLERSWQRSGLANRHLIIEGHRRSGKVKEGHGWSFSITRLTFQERKVIGGWWVVMACRIIVSAPVPVPLLWTLDLGFGTWIWDLDLGLDLGLTILLTKRKPTNYNCKRIPKIREI